ncbi:Autophagy-related protein [Pseudocercospora fuligena]|uniref:Autophagy-related protein 14 n=1 Tax=Pseudocercospora fuligena TaxID=685502 RepID=A0A8H6RB53_9PEZI|nr:Autophagy-related protein [Pseudocercospora fuligena]
MADDDFGCDVCARAFGGRRKPLCPSCAQAILYGSRIQQATGLLEREKHHSHAEAILRPGNDGVLASLPQDVDFDNVTTSIRKNSAERAQAQREATEFRINNVVEKAAELRKQIEDYRQTIVTRKEATENARKELVSQKTELEKSKPRAIEPVHNTTKKTYARLEKVRSRIVDARLLLCHEAAVAMNLSRQRSSNSRTEYKLGGIVIPDLRELNTRTHASAKAPLVGGRTLAEPHDLVSEAFENVARLVNLCSHYLSLRLPGELLVPHENFPRAAIMPEKSSYKTNDIKFPTSSSSQHSSPMASRTLEQDQPRPRPLWLDRPLGQLAKEEESKKAYKLFIEGVTMLAYNVAWLCKTQGMDSINNFDDVCAIGKNLYQLLMASSRKPPMSRKQTGTSSKVTTTSGKEDQGTRLGVFSHNSAEHNLASAEGLLYMRDWKIGSSTRLADKLLQFLASEMSAAEWEIVKEDEWDEDREDERPVLVGGSRRPYESKHAATMSIMTVAPHDGAEDERLSSASEAKKKEKAASGWMKVRGRGGGDGA